MHWFTLSLLSAGFLGFYEIAKKVSVRDNAVPPVLFFNVTTSALLWLPFVIWSKVASETIPFEMLRVASLTGTAHGQLFLKANIAGSSWIFASFALKHLPMSIAAPIRASSPLWTILIATLFMQERPSPLQWVGVAIILVSFWAFSLVGRREGIHFHRDRWVGFMLLATLLGSFSALYDKYLFAKQKHDTLNSAGMVFDLPCRFHDTPYDSLDNATQKTGTISMALGYSNDRRSAFGFRLSIFLCNCG